MTDTNHERNGVVLGLLAGVGTEHLVSNLVELATGYDIPIGAEMVASVAASFGLGKYGQKIGREADQAAVAAAPAR